VYFYIQKRSNMKLSQFRRLIKEEVQQALKESETVGTYKNGIYTGASLYIFEINPTKVAELEKNCKDFIKAAGPIISDQPGHSDEVLVTLDVKALIKRAQDKKIKDFGVYPTMDQFLVRLHPEDALSGSAGDSLSFYDVLPEVIRALEPYAYKSPMADFITVQIAPETRDYDFESGDYGTIEDYRIPTIIQTKLAGKQPAQDADNRELRRYVVQVRNQLTPLIKTVFPDAKFWDISVGGIGYRLTAEPTSQQKSKLKSLLKGALSIDFDKSYVKD
jgi:hypothetical protein